MFNRYNIFGNWKLHIQAVSAVMLSIAVTGCGTVAYLENEYAGYKVIDKNAKVETKSVAIRVTSCVTPNGLVLCERRYGAFTECSVKCKTPENKWVERPEGYGGYEDQTVTNYYLVLQSPAGVAETVPASELQYNGLSVGQIIGAAAP